MSRFRERAYWSLERKITPGLKSAQGVYATVLQRYITEDTRWLDVGCGHQVFEPWIGHEQEMVSRAKFVVGSDPDLSSLRQHRSITHRAACVSLPFADRSFSLVSANMVLEHVRDPVAFFADIRRVLMLGGHCIVHTPNARHWQVWASRFVPQRVKNALIHIAEGRPPDDVYPTHYIANTRTSLERTVTNAGLQVETIRMLDTSTTSRIFMGPFMLLDLFMVRLQRHAALEDWRSNMIGVFRAV